VQQLGNLASIATDGRATKPNKTTRRRSKALIRTKALGGISQKAWDRLGKRGVH
jgi:hypothetical protein